MDAVVLVGGFGTRLRPLTNTIPKQMLSIGHRTMLEAVLDRLARQGVTRAVLSLGYKPEVFRDRWPDGRIAGIDVDYAIDPYPLDTAGAIRYAALHAGVDSTFVALNGDIITSLDLADQLDQHRSTGAVGTIHLVPVDDPSRFGVVSIDDTNRVLGFVEKPPREEAPSNLINAGTYIFEPEVLDLVPDNEAVSIERVTFPLLVEQGGLFGYQHSSDVYWVDAGTPDALLQANLDLVNGVWTDAIPALGEGAEVDPSATLDNVLVGARARIGAARVGRSVVMPGAVVGDGAVLEGSIIGDAAKVAPGAKVIDKMVGPGEPFPSQAD